MVTSGAVAIGKLRVKQEQLLSRSVRHTLLSSVGKRGVADDLEPRACAAAGQAGLMALYETMFNQYGVGCAQVRSKNVKVTVHLVHEYHPSHVFSMCSKHGLGSV